MSNYYLASKSIVGPDYYESVVRNAILTNSTIVVDNSDCIPKVIQATKRLGVKLKSYPITLDDYVQRLNSGRI